MDGTVRVWDVPGGQPVGHLVTGRADRVAVDCVAVSPHGGRLAVGGSDGTVWVWDVATGQLVGPPMTGHTDWVNSVAFSPDGARLVSGGSDGTVRVWDIASGQTVGSLTGHTGAVRSVAFSPDGTCIASGSDDSTVRLWPAFPDPVAALCAKLTTNMSRRQWREWVSPDLGYIPACKDLPVAPD
jgi:WD40 repeat protein